MAEKKNRIVKLHGKHRPFQGHWSGLKEVPWLNVSGVWLERAGFGVGVRVEITVRENELVIKRLS